MHVRLENFQALPSGSWDFLRQLTTSLSQHHSFITVLNVESVIGEPSIAFFRSLSMRWTSAFQDRGSGARNSELET